MCNHSLIIGYWWQNIYLLRRFNIRATLSGTQFITYEANRSWHAIVQASKKCNIRSIIYLFPWTPTNQAFPYFQRSFRRWTHSGLTSWLSEIQTKPNRLERKYEKKSSSPTSRHASYNGSILSDSTVLHRIHSTQLDQNSGYHSLAATTDMRAFYIPPLSFQPQMN